MLSDSQIPQQTACWQASANRQFLAVVDGAGILSERAALPSRIAFENPVVVHRQRPKCVPFGADFPVNIHHKVAVVFCGAKTLALAVVNQNSIFGGPVLAGPFVTQAAFARSTALASSQTIRDADHTRMNADYALAMFERLVQD